MHGRRHVCETIATGPAQNYGLHRAGRKPTVLPHQSRQKVGCRRPIGLLSCSAGATKVWSRFGQGGCSTKAPADALRKTNRQGKAATGPGGSSEATRAYSSAKHAPARARIAVVTFAICGRFSRHSVPGTATLASANPVIHASDSAAFQYTAANVQATTAASSNVHP